MISGMRKIIYGFCLLICTFNAFGLVNYGVSLGNMGPVAGRYQDDIAGGTENAIFSFYPYVGAHAKILIGPAFYFLPEAGYVFKNSAHDGADAGGRSQLFALYNVGFAFLPTLLAKAGIGTFITKIHGEGGTIKTQNGSGTATFFLPEESQSSYNTTINFGIEVNTVPKFGLKLEAHIWNILGSQSRGISFEQSLKYYF